MDEGAEEERDGRLEGRGMCWDTSLREAEAVIFADCVFPEARLLSHTHVALSLQHSPCARTAVYSSHTALSVLQIFAQPPTCMRGHKWIIISRRTADVRTHIVTNIAGTCSETHQHLPRTPERYSADNVASSPTSTHEASESASYRMSAES